jgi:alpha/beta superfamily hydrolase
VNASLDILTKLIAIPSVSGDFAANNHALEYIDSFLSARGMHVARFEFEGFGSMPGKPSTS